MNKTITVRQVDIDRGCRNNSQKCAIVRAIQRDLPNYSNILVGKRTVSATRDGVDYIGFLPKIARKFITRFDRVNGKELCIAFQFEIELRKKK